MRSGCGFVCSLRTRAGASAHIATESYARAANRSIQVTDVTTDATCLVAVRHIMSKCKLRPNFHSCVHLCCSKRWWISSVQADSVTLRFAIKTWCAHGGGLHSQSAWQAWAQRPGLLAGVDVPALEELAPMARRRLGVLGKMAVQVSFWCQSEANDAPIVFASRYGDAQRSLELLHQHAAGEALSPTAFGLSVHNAIGAQYSIARSSRGNHLSIAAGAGSASAAVLEATALLHDGAGEVMVVCYDAPLPGDYAAFSDEPACHYAWAWLLRRPDDSPAPSYSLSVAASGAAEPAQAARLLPHGLDVLRFILAGDRQMCRRVDGLSWAWQRHG